jgi:hypothetical protein
VVQLDVALLECSPGEDFVNRGLWEVTDEGAVSLDRKADLDDNGFRVCQVGGLPPAGLQALLTSPRANPNPRRIQVPAGEVVPIPLAPAAGQCRFRLHTDGLDRDLEFKDACCWLDVVPTLAEDGRLRLHFTPRVQHGTASVRFTPRRDPSGSMRWERQEEQPEVAFDRMAWEVTVVPNEFVAVGTRLDRPGTLGQACFLSATEGSCLQRLLVFRTARPAAETTAAAPQLGATAPLAVRAGLGTVRGVGE